MLIGSGFLWIINRKGINYQKGIIILLIAFATIAPYLIYTYHLTGRIYYLGTSGGNNLYWMSTPYEGVNMEAGLPAQQSNLTLFLLKKYRH